MKYLSALSSFTVKKKFFFKHNKIHNLDSMNIPSLHVSSIFTLFPHCCHKMHAKSNWKGDLVGLKVQCCSQSCGEWQLVIVCTSRSRGYSLSSSQSWLRGMLLSEKIRHRRLLSREEHHILSGWGQGLGLDLCLCAYQAWPQAQLSPQIQPFPPIWSHSNPSTSPSFPLLWSLTLPHLIMYPLLQALLPPCSQVQALNSLWVVLLLGKREEDPSCTAAVWMG